MHIQLSGYIPENGDVLLISRPYGGGIGIEVRTRRADDWVRGPVMYASETERYTEYRYLLHHREFEAGWFYWIWRETGERPEPRRWIMRRPFEKYEG